MQEAVLHSVSTTSTNPDNSYYFTVCLCITENFTLVSNFSIFSSYGGEKHSKVRKGACPVLLRVWILQQIVYFVHSVLTALNSRGKTLSFKWTVHVFLLCQCNTWSSFNEPGLTFLTSQVMSTVKYNPFQVRPNIIALPASSRVEEKIWDRTLLWKKLLTWHFLIG